MEEDTLYLQLHKLSTIKSEGALDQILTTLWQTRKTGLSAPEKSKFQSLLNLSSPAELDPVLACLRSLIRKYVNDDCKGKDISNLFPPDISLVLQKMIVLLFQKYKDKWKEDISGDKYPLPRINVPSTSVPSSEITTSLRPHQDDPIVDFNSNDFGGCTRTIAADSCLSHISLQQDLDLPHNLGCLPHLKSVTWTIERRNSPPTVRVAIVTLKLQDDSKSPSVETEVKFQVTKNTVEDMLALMTHISEKLSRIAESSSGPPQKKQKQ